MQREVIKWLQGINLSTPIRNPRRDLANGVAVAEIVSHYCERSALRENAGEQEEETATAAAVRLNARAIDVSATSAEAKRNNWNEVLRVLALLRCATVTTALAEAVVHLHPNAAQAVLENLYEFFTHRKLAMRSAAPLVVEDGAAKAAVPEGNYLATRDAVQQAATFLETAGEITATNADGAAAASTQHRRQLPKGQSLKVFLADPQAQTAGVATDRDRKRHQAATPPTAGYGGGGTAHTEGGEALAELQDALLPSAAAEVQTVLALTRNAELAGGPRALLQQATTHYTRPTASSLVHGASSTRHNVSLTRPKYAEDERTAQQRNKRILAQHATLEKAYFREQGPSAAVAAATATGLDRGGHAKKGKSESATKGSAKVQESLPTLTAILRGPFAANASTRPNNNSNNNNNSGNRRRRTTKSTRSGEAGKAAAPASRSGEWGPPVARDTASLCVSDSRGNTAGGTGAAVSMPGPQRIKVNTMPDSLRAALQGNGVYLNGEERAGAKSVQLFQSSHWRLPTALSHLLKDVLHVRRELDPLLDMSRQASTVYRSDDVVMQDLLSCVVAHRRGLAHETLAACWDAIEQNVTGIAASVLHRPSEYEYLLQTLSYAFTARAARVRLLHVSRLSDSSGSVGGERGSRPNLSCGPADESPHDDPVEPQRGRSQSIGNALLTAARRRPSYAEALHRHHHDAVADPSLDGGTLEEQQQQQQQAIVKDEEALEIGRVFILLRDVGSAVLSRSRDPTTMTREPSGDAPVPLRVMEKFFLPTVQRFIFSTGSPATVEAAARVIVATLFPSSNSIGGSAEAAADTQQVIYFLEATVQQGLQRQLAAATTSACEERYALVAYHVLSQLVQRLCVASADLAAKDNASSQDGDSDVRETSHVAAATALDSAHTAVHHYTLHLANRCLDPDKRSSTVHAVGVALLLLVAPTAPLGAEDGGGDGASPSPSALFWTLVQRIAAEQEEEGSSTRASSSWETRALTLELLLVVGDRLASETGSSGDTKDNAGAPSAAQTLERAAVACLEASTRGTDEVQQQLALSIVSRRLTPDVRPRLCEHWLGVLLSLPDDDFQRCLLPYEAEPLSLGVGNIDDMEHTTLPSTSTPLPSSSIRLLFGAVQPPYIVAPLNQYWNTSGVVQLVLRSLPSMSRASVLAIVAAALISPQPVATQEKELCRNLQLLSAVNSTTKVDRGSGGEGGDEYALTLRDVLAATRTEVDQHSDAGENDAADPQEDEGGDGRLPSDDVVGTAMFWRGALRYLAPVIRASLRASPRESMSEHDDEDTDAEQETAAAVLFTLFRKCATPDEVARVDTNRGQGMDSTACLLDWAAQFEL